MCWNLKVFNKFSIYHKNIVKVSQYLKELKKIRRRLERCASYMWYTSLWGIYISNMLEWRLVHEYDKSTFPVLFVTLWNFYRKTVIKSIYHWLPSRYAQMCGCANFIPASKYWVFDAIVICWCWLMVSKTMIY